MSTRTRASLGEASKCVPPPRTLAPGFRKAVSASANVPGRWYSLMSRKIDILFQMLNSTFPLYLTGYGTARSRNLHGSDSEHRDAMFPRYSNSSYPERVQFDWGQAPLPRDSRR